MTDLYSNSFDKIMLQRCCDNSQPRTSFEEAVSYHLTSKPDTNNSQCSALEEIGIQRWSGRTSFWPHPHPTPFYSYVVSTVHYTVRHYLHHPGQPIAHWERVVTWSDGFLKRLQSDALLYHSSTSLQLWLHSFIALKLQWTPLLPWPLPLPLNSNTHLTYFPSHGKWTRKC